MELLFVEVYSDI